MKGMAHTPFAIFAVTMLLILFMVPLNSVPEEARQDIKGSEAENARAHNLENSLAKGLGITASEYIEAANNYVADQGFVSDAEAATDFETGEFDGEDMNTTSYTEWVSGLESRYSDRGMSVEYSYSNLSVEPGVEVEGVADLQYELNRSSIRYSFDSSKTGESGLRGQDPLLADASSGSFTPEYSYCGFDTPAHQVGSGSSSSGEVAHGYAAVKPEDLTSVDTSDSRVLVVEDASEYDSTELSAFNGVIAEASGSIEDGGYARVSGLDVSEIAEGDSLIMDGVDVWQSFFREITDENCYIRNSNAPGVIERMEGSFSSSSQGITTFIGSTSNAAELNEAYMYYDNEASSNSSISGVTTGDYGDFRPWFKLADGNIGEWNIGDLSE